MTGLATGTEIIIILIHVTGYHFIQPAVELGSGLPIIMGLATGSEMRRGGD